MLKCDLLIAVLLLLSPASGDSKSWWSIQSTGIDTNLRGVSVVCCEGNSGKQGYVMWASGSHGVVLRSVDDGNHWKQMTVPGAEDLDFRDIEAFDANTAYLMSTGDSNKSRIYKTTDAGKTWKLQYSHKRKDFFLDSLACDSNVHCVALSDPVDDKFLVLETKDGETWNELPRDKMPPALSKEGAFAASGTAIALCESGIYFGTGGPAARIFHSKDGGHSWTAIETPIGPAGASSGIFSMACYGSENVVAVGGDYKLPADSSKVAIYSDDAGSTWQLAKIHPGGYRSAVASISYGDLVAVGLNGTDVSHDRGVTWQHTDPLSLNAVASSGNVAWAVGPKGTIAKLNNRFQYEIRLLPQTSPVFAALPEPNFPIQED